VIVPPLWQSAWWWPTLESMRLGPPHIISGSISDLPAGRNPDEQHYKENEAYLYKSAEENLTPNKRGRLYSGIFGSNVRTPRSLAKHDDFYDVTPVLDKAVSGDPVFMQMELLHNKCIVIFRVVLISRRADFATLQLYSQSSL